MKKITALFLTLSISVPVLAQEMPMNKKQRHSERYQSFVIPANSVPVSQIAQGIEKQGYQVYGIRPDPKSGYYRVVSAKGSGVKVKQYYNMKTGHLVPNTDAVYQKHSRKFDDKRVDRQATVAQVQNKK